MRIRTRDRSSQGRSYQDRSSQGRSPQGRSYQDRSSPSRTSRPPRAVVDDGRYRLMDAPLWSEIDADHVVLDLYGGCLPLELTAAGLGPLGQCDHLDVTPGFSVCGTPERMLNGRSADGTVLWSKEYGQILPSFHLGETPMLFTANEGGSRHWWTLDLATGQPVETNYAPASTPRISGSFDLPIFQDGSILSAFSADLSQELWRFELDEESFGRAWHVGDRVVFTNYSEGTKVLDSTTGELIATYRPGNVAAVSSDGVLMLSDSSLFLADLP